MRSYEVARFCFCRCCCVVLFCSSSSNCAHVLVFVFWCNIIPLLITVWIGSFEPLDYPSQPRSIKITRSQVHSAIQSFFQTPPPPIFLSLLVDLFIHFQFIKSLMIFRLYFLSLKLFLLILQLCIFCLFDCLFIFVITVLIIKRWLLSLFFYFSISPLREKKWGTIGKLYWLLHHLFSYRTLWNSSKKSNHGRRIRTTHDNSTRIEIG